eukprot:4277757-Heterocapsa_arctica.AAC.1
MSDFLTVADQLKHIIRRALTNNYPNYYGDVDTAARRNNVPPERPLYEVHLREGVSAAVRSQQTSAADAREGGSTPGDELMCTTPP